MALVAVGPGAAISERKNPGDMDMQVADLRDRGHGRDERELPPGQTACPPNPRVRRYGAAPSLVESSAYGILESDVTRDRSCKLGAVEANSQSVRCPPRIEQSGGIKLENYSAEPEEFRVEPLRNVKMPIHQEIEEREISHCSYRVWCSSCVMACGGAGRRHRQVGGDPAGATISCDYCSTGSQMDLEVATRSLGSAEASPGISQSDGEMARKKLMQAAVQRYRELVGIDGVTNNEIIVIYEELACREASRENPHDRSGRRIRC